MTSDNASRVKTSRGVLLLYGGLAGICAKTVVNPLERIKLLRQTGQTNAFLEGLQHIFKAEGLIGFWRGNYTNCVRAAPNKALTLATNDYWKQFLLQLGLASQDSKNVKFFSGCLAGLTAVSCTYPFDVVRMRLAAFIRNKKDSTVKPTMSSVFSRIYFQEGLMGFTKGLGLTYMFTVPYSGLKFYFFGRYRDFLGENFLAMTLSGAFAGATAFGLCYPIDTVRRNMQVQGSNKAHQYNSSVHCAKSLFLKYGIQGLFPGFGVNLLWIMPNSMIMFTVYEYLKSF